VSRSFPLPSVIRLIYMVKRPMVTRRLSRRAVFYRDAFTCQYCGTETKNLTLDHIKPRSQKGPHVWENVVSACIPCNHRKAGRTPRQANMKLLRVPRAMKPNPYYLFHHRQILDEWREFIPWVD
jgi:5-methylcytosine-specific restriction endonuclease McrA